MTRSRGFVLVALLVAAATGGVLAADITGTWTAEFDSQIGVQKYTYTFKADGDKLTGTAVGERMGQRDEVVLTNVTVKDDQVSFVEPLNFQGQEISITYTGKIVGDEIKFTRKVGDFATEELVAKRKQP